MWIKGSGGGKRVFLREDPAAVVEPSGLRRRDLLSPLYERKPHRDTGNSGSTQRGLHTTGALNPLISEGCDVNQLAC